MFVNDSPQRGSEASHSPPPIVGDGMVVNSDEMRTLMKHKRYVRGSADMARNEQGHTFEYKDDKIL